MSLYIGSTDGIKEVSSLLIGTGDGCSKVRTLLSGDSIVYENLSYVDEELRKTNPVELLTSGLITKEDIGKTVYLSNEASPCQEWRIADVNHDDTTGTVDLFPKYVVNNDMIFGDDNTYSSSGVRSWLNGTFYNGFTEDVKNALKVQSFPSNDETLEDKVKCPSLNEVGLTFSDWVLYEGTIYPIFGDTLIDGTNPLSKYTTTDGGGVMYWTRSRNTYDSYGVWIVTADGSYYYYCNSYNCSRGVVACLRF